MAVILITGGTGLIGRALTKKLIQEGHNVRWLSRNPQPLSSVTAYFWDVEKRQLDVKALEGVEHVIHLAGAGIADKRWTNRRKEDIIRSRVDGAELISHYIREKKICLTSFVGASAIGVYGMHTTDNVYTETDEGSDDFLAQTCRQWEKAYDTIRPYATKNSIIRVSLVLSKQGGVLQKLRPLFRLGLGSAIGSGKQYMPWIHIDDLASVFYQALFNPHFNGTFNASAPEHVTNREFSHQLAQSLSKPFLMPAVPAFILKLMYGEMADLVLTGSRVSNQKLMATGLEFKYATLKSALDDTNG